MLQETTLYLLCVVAFVLLAWAILLQLRLERLEKKVKALEEKKRQTE